MTFVVWASTVFGPRVWPLSARCHYVLRDEIHGSLQVQLKLLSNLKNHKAELHLILPETADRETFEHIS